MTEPGPPKGGPEHLRVRPIDFPRLRDSPTKSRAVNVSDLCRLSDAQMARLDPYFRSLKASPASMIGL